MADYERDQTVAVDAQRLYDYLSDVHHLPNYFARMRSARLIGDDEVHTVAIISPPGEPEKRVQGTAWFRRDDDAKSIEWGAESDNNYRGSLTVHAIDDSCSRVVLTLHLETDHPGIEEGIDRTLETIEKVAGAEA